MEAIARAIQRKRGLAMEIAVVESGQIESIAKRISDVTAGVYSYYEVIEALNAMKVDRSKEIIPFFMPDDGIDIPVKPVMTPKQYGMSLKKKKRLNYK